jgi:hypothetical protein
MFGKHPHLNPLQSRKQMLIAESELDRARLVQEWQTMAGQVRSLRGRAQSWSAIASSAAVLVTGLAAFRHNNRSEANTKPSWLETALKWVSLGSTFWMAMRSQRRDASEKTKLL